MTTNPDAPATQARIRDYGVMATVTVISTPDGAVVARAVCYRGNVSPTERQVALQKWAELWSPSNPVPDVAGVRPLF